jgi:hypothetical protein
MNLSTAFSLKSTLRTKKLFLILAASSNAVNYMAYCEIKRAFWSPYLSYKVEETGPIDEPLDKNVHIRNNILI